jgi:hypothetical protein
MAARETTARQIITADEVTAQGATAEGAAEKTPVACSLTQAGLAVQASRWTRLADRAMTERTKTAHGLRMGFRPEPGAEQELRELVAVETECCPWATWTVETSPGQIVLDIRSAGEGIAALHDMFTSLRPSRPC